MTISLNILVKNHGKGYKATDEAGNSAIAPINFALSGSDRYVGAAVELAEKMGYSGTMHYGYVAPGMVAFVFDSDLKVVV